MNHLHDPTWGDLVALSAQGAGPAEGLVVDVDARGDFITVESKQGRFVGGTQWQHRSKFIVVRKATFA